MHSDQVVREQLLALLIGGNAHMTFEQAVADFPAEHYNTRPPNITYTPWHILEHLRIAQWDIFEFIRNPNYESPQWPEGYWPHPSEMTDPEGWERTISAFLADLGSLRQIVKTRIQICMPKFPTPRVTPSSVKSWWSLTIMPITSGNLGCSGRSWAPGKLSLPLTGLAGTIQNDSTTP
jgi:hypothetical protein